MSAGRERTEPKELALPGERRPPGIRPRPNETLSSFVEERGGRVQPLVPAMTSSREVMIYPSAGQPAHDVPANDLPMLG